MDSTKARFPPGKQKTGIHFERIGKHKPSNYWSRPDTWMLDYGQVKKVWFEDG